MKNKAMRIMITVAVMLLMSRFLVRLIDATVGIDDDIGMLLAALAIMNGIILLVSIRLGRRLQ